jgi:iron complex outermembrane recepter protein
VSNIRHELQTPGYALVNMRTSYEWGNIRLDGGIENLFDKQYYSPLGGVYMGDTATKTNAANGLPLSPLAGTGRNFYAGLTVKF